MVVRVILIQTTGEYPVVINERNSFSHGNHSLLFHIRDNLGFTARTTVSFKLTDEQTITNSKKLADNNFMSAKV